MLKYIQQPVFSNNNVIVDSQDNINLRSFLWPSGFYFQEELNYH